MNQLVKYKGLCITAGGQVSLEDLKLFLLLRPMTASVEFGYVQCCMRRFKWTTVSVSQRNIHQSLVKILEPQGQSRTRSHVLRTKPWFSCMQGSKWVKLKQSFNACIKNSHRVRILHTDCHRTVLCGSINQPWRSCCRIQSRLANENAYGACWESAWLRVAGRVWQNDTSLEGRNF